MKLHDYLNVLDLRDEVAAGYVTGLNELTVWEHMRDNHYEIYELIASLPEEFKSWVVDVARDLERQAEAISDESWGEWCGVVQSVWPHVDVPTPALVTREERKAVAEVARTGKYPNLTFMILDSNFAKRRSAIWQMIRPKGVSK